MKKLVLPPELAKQWHPRLNPPLLPDGTTPKGTLKPWWLDEYGHEWAAETYRRITRKAGCPYCAGKKKASGYNDLATTYPEIAKLWHPTKNNTPTPPLEITNLMKFWWLGVCNHEWQRNIVGMKASSACPFCQGKEVLVGDTDLSSQNPHLAKQWHPTKNIHYPDGAKSIHKNSNILIWWLCDLGHEWEQSPHARSKNGIRCPTCSGKRILTDFNDLKTLYPDLAAEWHPTKNQFLVNSIGYGSSKKAWWVCSKNHEWQAEIQKRTTNNTGCPVCSGNKVLQGYNDLATQSPVLAVEWHPTKNMLKPSEVTVRSGQNVWWLCSKGHEWIISPSNRNHGQSGCPDCNRVKYTSKAEQEISNYLSTLNMTHILNDRKALNGTELDLYVPSKKIAIEFNGLYWHNEMSGKHRNYHHDKWLKAKNADIQLIQIWEDDWLSKKELVKIMIAHKLGVSNQKQIYARKTSVTKIETEEARTFFSTNHIQGFASGSFYVGLRDNKDNILVALLSIKKESNNGFNIIRYATAAHVVGGFTKLLTYVTLNYSPEYYFTFADHTVSNGLLYENNGFVADKELPPDYMYVRGNKRHHKFGYRLKRFQADSSLQYVEGLTERELANINHIPRIWDAGKTRYIKTVTK